MPFAGSVADGRLKLILERCKEMTAAGKSNNEFGAGNPGYPEQA